MSGKYQPAIIAGVVLGVVLIVIGLVTSFLPALWWLGCCACLLPVGAGMFAANQYVARSEASVQIGDGAILGAISGAVGSLLNLVVGLPISYLINAQLIAEQSEQLRRMGFPLTGFPLILAISVLGFVIYSILGLIGGLIGVAVFEKRKGGAGGPPPPPPPAGGYGGPTGGGYGDPAGGYGGGQAGGGGWGNPSPPGGGGYGQGS